MPRASPATVMGTCGRTGPAWGTTLNPPCGFAHHAPPIQHAVACTTVSRGGLWPVLSCSLTITWPPLLTMPIKMNMVMPPQQAEAMDLRLGLRQAEAGAWGREQGSRPSTSTTGRVTLAAMLTITQWGRSPTLVKGSGLSGVLGDQPWKQESTPRFRFLAPKYLQTVQRLPGGAILF